MHDARKKAMAERGRIVSQAAMHGALTDRVPVIIAARQRVSSTVTPSIRR